ncbi:acylsugar acyltransferase 3 [Artemisia annua]|uniref:Acylsugar acyltransferase 3 n=1 Tax=Artemisia annua TaxID=35608 RepID=A0A2U1PQF1_ARTAN|nr:acylsugar acyltransferase 3 [Artemisia annua]
MTIVSNLVRFGRRQLHTIVSSREIIKPSSPTPSHLKTHNLSLLDQTSNNSFMPIVSFYPNTVDSGSAREKTLALKKSLSQTLAKYYPFAGRHAKFAPYYVDCNDEGAVFHEASVDSTLSDFLQNSVQNKDLDHFFPYGLVNFRWNREYHDLQSDKVIPLAVQVNHFECGGVAVAVSLSHKLADGSNLVQFIGDWAKMTKFSSLPTDPHYLSLPEMNINFPGLSIECSVSAATKNNSGSFKPTLGIHLASMRARMIEPLPDKTIGNLFTPMEIFTNQESDLRPEVFISELKKQKMQSKGIKNIETLFEILSGMSSEIALKEMQRKLDEGYLCSSLCGLPIYDIDFGWGNPVKTTLGGNAKQNSFILIDTPKNDGIEALVCLGEEDMNIFQNDPELLSFC